MVNNPDDKSLDNIIIAFEKRVKNLETTVAPYKSRWFYEMNPRKIDEVVSSVYNSLLPIIDIMLLKNGMNISMENVSDRLALLEDFITVVVNSSDALIESYVDLYKNNIYDINYVASEIVKTGKKHLNNFTVLKERTLNNENRDDNLVVIDSYEKASLVISKMIYDKNLIHITADGNYNRLASEIERNLIFFARNKDFTIMVYPDGNEKKGLAPGIYIFNRNYGVAGKECRIHFSSSDNMRYDNYNLPDMIVFTPKNTPPLENGSIFNDAENLIEKSYINPNAYRKQIKN